MAFNNYLEEENDKPYFTQNSLAYYYDKMEGFAKAVEGSAKALNLTKEEVERRITLYIEQNKNELDQRLADWDGKLETFDGSVEKLLTEWVDDGTLTHVIDSTLIDEKIQPLTAQLAETVKRDETGVLDLNIFDEPTRAMIQGLASGEINAVLGVGNVTPENLSFLPVIGEEGKNLFDKNKVVVDYYVDHVTGDRFGPNTLYTHFKRNVKPNQTYTRKYPQRLAFYDSNDVFISGVFNSLTVTSPPNAAIVRFDVLKTNLNLEQFEEGSVSTSYEPYKFVAGKDSLKNGIITQEKMDVAFLQQLMNGGMTSAMTTENEPWEVV